MDDEWSTASSRARIRIMEGYATRYYNALLSNGQVASVSTNPKWIQVFEYVKNLTPTNRGHFFITINPPTDDLSLLQKVVERIRNYRNFLGDMTYCYEVRQPNKGLHVHIYADDVGKPRSDVHRRCYNAAHQYFTDINLKAVHVEHCDEGPLEYIRGVKADESKGDAIQWSIDYRRNNNLETVYELPG